MARLSRTRYQGGPLSDYGGSFTGLKQFYKLQQPGETQHEQLQNEAVNQQRAAGGFYRPGSEPAAPPPFIPKLDPLPPPSFTPHTEGAYSVDAPTLSLMNQEREKGTITDEQWRGANKLLSQGDDPTDVRARLRRSYWHNYAQDTGNPAFAPPASAPRSPLVIQDQGDTFARPVGMDGDSPPILGGGPVPAGGRSMSDPNRIVDTVLRGHRGDARTQIAGADYFRGNQDRLAAGEAEAAKARTAAQVHQDLITHQAAETQRKKESAAGIINLGPGVAPMPTVAAQRLASDQERQKGIDARSSQQLSISEAQLAIAQARAQREAEDVQRKLNPQGSVLSIPGTSLGVPTLNGQRIANVPTLQMTVPQQTRPTFPEATVTPPQFKPLATKAEPPPKPPPVKNFGDSLKTDWREYDHKRGAWVPVRFADKNKNGVPDDMEGGGLPVPTNQEAINAMTKKPTTGFLNAVK